MTPKQRVLKKWPLAFAWDIGQYKSTGLWKILKGTGGRFNEHEGEGATPAAAWADAAKRLSERKTT